MIETYAQQLRHIKRRLASYPEGHSGLQLCAAYRMADLVRLGRPDLVAKIAQEVET